MDTPNKPCKHCGAPLKPETIKRAGSFCGRRCQVDATKRTYNRSPHRALPPLVVNSKACKPKPPTP